MTSQGSDLEACADAVHQAGCMVKQEKGLALTPADMSSSQSKKKAEGFPTTQGPSSSIACPQDLHTQKMEPCIRKIKSEPQDWHNAYDAHGVDSHETLQHDHVQTTTSSIGDKDGKITSSVTRHASLQEESKSADLRRWEVRDGEILPMNKPPTRKRQKAPPKPKEFECSVCHKLYVSAKTLYVHKKRHIQTDSEAVKCDVCNEWFSSEISMLCHKETHNTGTKLFECKICKKGFTHCIGLQSHMKAHNKSIHVFVCHICNKQCDKQSQLDNHLRVHTGEKPFQCELCPKKYAQKGALLVHIRTHTNEKPYKCDICGMAFSYSNARNRHMRNHSGEKKKYECDVCHKTFSSEYGHKSHMNMHTGQNSFCCKLCSKTFTSQESLRRHLIRHAGTQAHQCSLCDKKFVIKSQLLSHMKTHQRKKSINCDVCNETFENQFKLTVHKRTHLEKTFECHICHAKFNLKGFLKKHQEVHLSEDLKPFKCEKCPKRFVRACELASHAKGHLKEVLCTKCKKVFKRSLNHKSLYCNTCYQQIKDARGYKCNKCPIKFNTFLQLRQHRRKHSTKRIKCKRCNRVFSHPCYLKAHYAVVTTGNTAQEQCLSEFAGYYPCDLCRKVFKKKHNRDMHRMEHDKTVVMKYKCETCGKLFLTKSRLVSHASAHKEDRPFACDLCDRNFKDINHLNKHKKCHKHSKVHTCGICQKVYSKLHFLKNHLRKKHNSEHTFKCTICEKNFKHYKYVEHMQQVHGEKVVHVDIPEIESNNEAETHSTTN